MRNDNRIKGKNGVVVPPNVLPLRRTATVYSFSVAVLVLVSCAKGLIVPDSSKLALDAGESTLILGSDCKQPLNLGYSNCAMKAAEEVPALRILMLNPGDYAVSDCSLGIYKTGSSQNAGFVEVDLSGLKDQILKQRFCLLRIETVERFPDAGDPNQTHVLPLVGGFFIEVLDSDYFPVPPQSAVSWCYQASRTTSGRTALEKCP